MDERSVETFILQEIKKYVEKKRNDCKNCLDKCSKHIVSRESFDLKSILKDNCDIKTSEIVYISEFNNIFFYRLENLFIICYLEDICGAVACKVRVVKTIDFPIFDFADNITYLNNLILFFDKFSCLEQFIFYVSTKYNKTFKSNDNFLEDFFEDKYVILYFYN